MPSIESRIQNRHGDNIWPGFVDALATLLLVIIFILAVFMITHFFLSEALSGRDKALEQLNGELLQISELLSLEKGNNEELRSTVKELSESLQHSRRNSARLQIKLEEGEQRLALKERNAAKYRKELKTKLSEIQLLTNKITSLTIEHSQLQNQARDLSQSLKRSQVRASKLQIASAELKKELSISVERTSLARKEINSREIQLRTLKRISSENALLLKQQKILSSSAQSKASLLQQQLGAVRQQLAALNAALQAAEVKDSEQAAMISNLGKRLNTALAQKIEELSQYRSEFFGKLRSILGERPDIRVVGDRFIFQSEVLFKSGSTNIGVPGKQQLSQLAGALLEISRDIPKDLPWVLRVDGHTDVIPISTERFPSNWELSTGRAVAVVKFLIEQGVPPSRLAAAGFGQFHSLDARPDEIGHRRNRRIELKLTVR